MEVRWKGAGQWLVSALNHRRESCDRTTIHTLKGTPLSWCGKFGLSSKTRLLLGHRFSGKRSLDTYGRDMLTWPLREYEGVLRQIRTDAFRSNNTRSELIEEAVQEDPKQVPTAEVSAKEQSQRASESSESSFAASKLPESVDVRVQEQEVPSHYLVVHLIQRKAGRQDVSACLEFRSACHGM